MDISTLVTQINSVHQWFSNQIARQIDTSLTLRNWMIGMYILEYEQHGADRARYGEKVLVEAAKKLKSLGLKGMAESTLKRYRKFYETYPQIWPTLSAKLQSPDNHLLTPKTLIVPTLSAQLPDIALTDKDGRSFLIGCYSSKIYCMPYKIDGISAAIDGTVSH